MRFLQLQWILRRSAHEAVLNLHGRGRDTPPNSTSLQNLSPCCFSSSYVIRVSHHMYYHPVSLCLCSSLRYILYYPEYKTKCFMYRTFEKVQGCTLWYIQSLLEHSNVQYEKPVCFLTVSLLRRMIPLHRLHSNHFYYKLTDAFRVSVLQDKSHR